MEKYPICVKCKYYVPGGYCSKFEKNKIDLIYGVVIKKRIYCEYERYNRIMFFLHMFSFRLNCGKKGRYFEK